MSNGAWKPEAGQRAWWINKNVDVKSIAADGTATVQYWGPGLFESMRTRRGVRLQALEQPREFVGVDDRGAEVYGAT